jgi:hypothetical protein
VASRRAARTRSFAAHVGEPFAPDDSILATVPTLAEPYTQERLLHVSVSYSSNQIVYHDLLAGQGQQARGQVILRIAKILRFDAARPSWSDYGPRRPAGTSSCARRAGEPA